MVIVSSKKADLFREKRVQRNLKYGDIVRAESVESDSEWVRVQHHGEIFVARKNDFRNRAEIDLAFELAKIDAETKLTEVEDELSDNVESQNRLHRTMLKVHMDRMTAFMIPSVIRAGEPRISSTRLITVDANGRPRESTPGISVSRDYKVKNRHIDKLTGNKAKRLIQDLQTGLKKAGKEFQHLRGKCRELIQKIFSEEIRWNYLHRRLDQFEQAESDLAPNELYLVTGNDVRLYQEKMARRQLAKGTVVIGRPNSQHGDWLKIVVGGDAYDSRTRFFTNHWQWEVEQCGTRIRIETDSEYLAADVDMLRFMEKLYQELVLKLEVDLNTNGDLVILNDIKDNCAICAANDVRCPHGVVETLDRTAARRSRDAWRSELVKVREAIKSKRSRIAGLRRELVNLNHDQAEINRRFDAMVAVVREPVIDILPE